MRKINLKINIDNIEKSTLCEKDFLNNAKKVLKNKSITGNIEIDLVFLTNDQTQKINYKFLKINQPTDVLSFPIYTKKGLFDALKKQKDSFLLLGEIIISYPQAKIQAKEKNILLKKEILFLFEHGLKHLLGYHHK